MTKRIRKKNIRNEIFRFEDISLMIDKNNYIVLTEDDISYFADLKVLLKK
ncbi:MAG TPA: hypothetical protein PKV21_03590 [bacterium]|nr:hypothetical protein [bacterium]